MQTITLITEISPENDIWGRVLYDDDLLVATAPSVPELEDKMKGLLQEFHDVPATDVVFEIVAEGDAH